jgi:hypothetical protein
MGKCTFVALDNGLIIVEHSMHITDGCRSAAQHTAGAINGAPCIPLCELQVGHDHSRWYTRSVTVTVNGHLPEAACNI